MGKAEHERGHAGWRQERPPTATWRFETPRHANDAAPLVSGQLVPDQDSVALELVEPASLAGMRLAGGLVVRYRDLANARGEWRPTLDTVRFEHPGLVARSSADPATGLDLATRFVAVPGGLNVEFSLRCVVEVAELRLEADVVGPANASLRGDTEALPRTERLGLFEYASADGPSLHVFLDRGEKNVAEHFEEGGRLGLRLGFFGAPLEKGVILIGRFAVRVPSADDTSGVRRLAERWLEEPSYL